MLNRSSPDETPEPQGTAGSGRAGAVLDEQALANLRALDPKGHNRLIERVVAAFETSTSRLLPQLAQAMQGNDMAAVRHVAHTLKSSSASVGALELSRQCAEIEAMVREHRVEDLAPRVEALQAGVRATLAALRTLPTSAP
jgi:HPt (histidine-containing phosphotransfer) domain-containing protein